MRPCRAPSNSGARRGRSSRRASVSDVDDPLLAWHEAFVASGYEVEDLATNDITRDFVAFGRLANHRLVLWRGFNDAVNILVESEHLKGHPLIRTWQKLPSGGSSSYGWLGTTRWNGQWR